jgi:hypothetical protein
MSRKNEDELLVFRAAKLILWVFAATMIGFLAFFIWANLT